MIRRGPTTAIAIALVATTLALATEDAGAWTDGACTTPSGVTVVVDFQELGGGVHVRCAPQPVTNGFEALRQAGIDFSTTVRFPGFLCRIAGEPANDPCQTTSPATAYWSYWIAQRGGPWCYSSWGAGNRTPPPGSVEGWSFSLGRTSSTAPAPRAAVPGPLPGTAPTALAPGDCERRADAPVAPPTTTRPAASPPPTAPPSIGPSGSPTPGRTAGGSTPGATSPTAAPDAAATTPGADVVGDVTTTTAAAQGVEDLSDAEDQLDASPTGDERPGGGDPNGQDDRAVALRVDETAAVDLGGDPDRSGSPLGVLVAVVLVAALTGGAFLARRRSRAAHAT